MSEKMKKEVKTLPRRDLLTVLEDELFRVKLERDESRGVKWQMYYLGKIHATTKVIKLIKKGYTVKRLTTSKYK